MITIKQEKGYISEKIGFEIQTEDEIIGLKNTLPEAILFAQGVLNSVQELGKSHEITMILIPNTPAIDFPTFELPNAYSEGMSKGRNMGGKISH